MSAPSAPVSAGDFLDLLRRSEIVRPDALAATLEELGDVPADPGQCAAALIRVGLITKFQAKLLLTGRFRGFKVGPYVLREQIGQGGMGAVFLAEHETLHRKVAVKVLTTGFGNKLAVERFLREARAAAALDHPNIVRIFDVFKAADNHYLVMEYVEGDTLEEVISRGEPIACGRAAGYVSQAAAGLQHAYEKGFVHRDIKPSNLMLAKDGTVKILDMGLARKANSQNDKLTEVMDQGAIVGTADFISPEQAMNAPHIDIRADIYSLGATFFALVTGKAPFEGNTTQKLLQHQLKEAPSLVAVDRTFPPGLAAVIATMLRKKPEDRFQNPAEVIAALAPWLPNSGGAAKVLAGLSSSDLNSSVQLQNTLNEVMNGGTQRMTLTGARRAGRKMPPAAVGLAAALLVVVALGGVYAAFGRKSTEDLVPPIASSGPPQASAAPPAQTPAQTPAPQTARTTYPVRLAPQRAGGSLAPVYAVDFAGTPNGSETLSTSSTRNDMAGKPLPPGVFVNHYSANSTGKYAVADVLGGRALGLRQVSGSQGAQLQLACDNLLGQLAAGETAVVRITYAATAARAANVSAQLGQEPWTKFATTELPATNGQWATLDVPFTRPSDGTKYEVIVAANPAVTGADVWVKAVQILVAAPAAAPLYAIDFAGTPVGAETVSTSATRNDLAGKPLPPGVQINHYNANATGKYAIADVAGGRALGLRHVAGEHGTQLMFDCDDRLGKLAPGETATVRLTYSAAAADAATVSVQLGEEPWTKFEATPLAATNGKWATVDVPFTRPATGPKFQVIVAANPGVAGADVWLKQLQILPAAQSLGAPLFHLDFAEIAPARSAIRGGNAGNRADQELRLPPGVRASSFRDDAVGGFQVADVAGARAIGQQQTGGTDGIQYELACDEAITQLAPGKSVVVRVVYLFDGTGVGRVAVQRQKDMNYEKFGVTELPPTNGQWRVADVPFTRPEDADRFAVIIAAGMDVPGTVHADGMLWVKSVDVLPVDAAAPTPAAGRPATAAKPPAVPAAPSVAPPAGSPLVAADFSVVTAFRASFADGKFADAFPPFPAGVTGHCWKKESAAEFRGDPAAGPAVGLTNLNEPLSAQLLFQVEGGLGANLQAGKSYTVWVEYKTANEAAGELSVRDPSYNTVAKAALSGTGGQWRWASVTVSRAEGKKLDAVVENGVVGEGNTIWVRKFEVRE
ncbi:MAG: serine/threonine-protein kinase [Gemmataceae bacterium]